MDGWVQHITDTNPEWQANITKLNLSAKTLNFISENIKGERMDIPAILSRLGNLNLIGIAKGEGTAKFDIKSHIKAGIGHVILNLEKNKQQAFKGFIDTQGIDLQRLLDDKQFGQLATNIHVEGRIPADGNPVINAKGIIHRFDYNDYMYRNIDVNGSYSKDNIIGKLSIDDPNIGLRIEGNIDKEAHTNNVNITTTIEHLSPQAINLSDQWGDARFNTSIVANFKANNLNDAVGSIDVKDFTMTSPTDYYQLDSLHIESGYEDEIRASLSWRYKIFH